MTETVREDIRNFAIIAHVDHGKTTLVDAILRQAGVFRVNEAVAERVMDSNDLERERGITIFSKNASYRYKGVKVNIIDTPGHADFGGEVERALRMVDSVMLLVDAAEGCLPQTKFVLKKSLELGLRPMVIINKIDRPDARALEVLDQVLELFIALDATDAQADFPYLFASSRHGYAKKTLDDPNNDLLPMLDMVLEHVPAPRGDCEAPLQLLVSSIQYNEYVGRMAVGRISRGTIKAGQNLALCRLDGKVQIGRATKLACFEGLAQAEVPAATVGDIVLVAGFGDVLIGETLCPAEAPEALPPLTVEEPTLSMTFGVNTSPLAGTEGKFVTSRHLRDRLERELLSNLALRVVPTDRPEVFRVSGRGELHLGILIETMRREGYELEVGKPTAVLKEVDGKLMEPYEQVVLDCPTDAMGAVMERMGARRGELKNMHPFGENHTRLEYNIPVRCLIGFRTELLTLTRGEGVLHTNFGGYGEYLGSLPGRVRGSLVAVEDGVTTTYALYSIQERGTLFVGANVKIYCGMIVGENGREGDIPVKVNRQKHLNNIRNSGSEEALVLTPPREMGLEVSLAYIEEDELVEVTPQNIRLRKKILDPVQRRRTERAQDALGAEPKA
jgi:GTP-binding protein